FSRPHELSLELEAPEKIVAEAMQAAAADPACAQVEFEVDVKPPLPTLRVDRRLVRQALVNRALNAAQASAQTGRVQVSAFPELHRGKNMLRIDVADQGQGIPEELLPRIFEPFFTTKAKGTGLGLAVVKRIIDDHEGEVEVSS